MREYAGNRKVNKGDRSKSPSITPEKIDEVLSALANLGLIQKQNGIYVLAAGVKNEKLQQTLDVINARLAKLRQSENRQQATRLPMHRPLGHKLPELR